MVCEDGFRRSRKKTLLFAYFRISVDSVVSDTSDASMDQWKLCAWRRLPRELRPTPVWNWLLVAAQRWEFNFRTVPQNQKFLARSFSVLCVCVWACSLIQLFYFSWGFLCSLFPSLPPLFADRWLWGLLWRRLAGAVFSTCCHFQW